jgi:hypothetical protein
MSNRRVLLHAACAATLVVLSAPALPAESVDELIARHIAARGGYERLMAVQTMRITRTHGTFGGNVPVVVTRQRPALLRVEQRLPNGRTVARGVNATAAWDTTPDGKVTERSAEAAADTRAIDADFDGLLVDYRKKGHTVAYAGRDRTGGVDTHKLAVTLSTGAVRTVFLDASTYLERKQVGTLTMPQGQAVPVTLTFGDYREVEGIMMPFAIDEERDAFPVQTIAIYVEKVELNVPVDPSAFEPPRAP